MFLTEDFLLTTPFAKELYHKYAQNMPIIDYHCHLDPKEIYENKPFKNITEAWLGGDHYKWRLMRANGINETLITGEASDYDKFLAYVDTLQYTLGNPLYAWTHLELQRFFGIDEILTTENAPQIYEKVNHLLQQDTFTPQALIQKSNVTVICTTDDPVDSLEYHQLLEKEDLSFKVYPAFRPDKALRIGHEGFLSWLELLENKYEKPINTYTEFMNALFNRMDFFSSLGCKVSDHGLDSLVFVPATEDELNRIFLKVLNKETLTTEEINKHVSMTLLNLLQGYKKQGWVTQLHLKALRNTNTKMYELLGPDTGYDGINDENIIYSLKELLDTAQLRDGLGKVILYSLNPQDYPTLVALMGTYQGEEITKFQLGSAWWFNDTRSGMREQLDILANGSLLPRFVGMLTDSRSFLSYPRHEYFRRVLCELLGEWVERGEAPEDLEYLGKIIQDISYNNAKAYFKFK